MSQGADWIVSLPFDRRPRRPRDATPRGLMPDRIQTSTIFVALD